MAVIAVTSGTSGAGKTTVAINLAAALGRLQRHVVLFDASSGSGTVARRLGLSEQPIPAHGPYGVQVVTPGTEAMHLRMARSELTELGVLIRALNAEADYVVVDTPTSLKTLTGIKSSVDDVVVVIDAHTRANRTVGFIRRLGGVLACARVGIVVNGVTAYDEGERVGRVATELARQRLDRPVELYGVVTADPDLARAQMMQRAVVECRPHADSSRCFQALARQVARTGPTGGGGLSRFAPHRPAGALIQACQMEARRCA